MRVTRLELENFRGVGKLQMEFDQHVTVLIGKNGAGKTTIIEGIYALLYQAVSRFVQTPVLLKVPDSEIRNGQDSTRLAIEVSIEGQPSLATWSISFHRNGQDQPQIAGNFDWIFGDGIAGGSVTDRNARRLPVIANYGVSRSEFTVSLKPSLDEQTDRPDIYESQGQANFRLFFEWYRVREDLENETRLSGPDKIDFRDPQLEAVRRAFLQMLPNFSDLRVRRHPLRLELKKEDEILLINQLSLGEKSLLAMIGDLARRLAILNPDLPNPLEGNGIILIDELDLHLHPHWQRNIIRQFRTVFPNCQFIVSTHSPQIVGEVEPSCLRILSKDAEGNFTVTIPEVSKGLDSAEVLQIVMDTPEREEEVSRNLRRIFDYIDGERFEEARSSISALKSSLGGSIPEIVRAETMIALLEP